MTAVSASSAAAQLASLAQLPQASTATQAPQPSQPLFQRTDAVQISPEAQALLAAEQATAGT